MLSMYVSSNAHVKNGQNVSSTTGLAGYRVVAFGAHATVLATTTATARGACETMCTFVAGTFERCTNRCDAVPVVQCARRQSRSGAGVFSLCGI